MTSTLTLTSTSIDLKRRCSNMILFFLLLLLTTFSSKVSSFSVTTTALRTIQTIPSTSTTKTTTTTANSNGMYRHRHRHHRHHYGMIPVSSSSSASSLVSTRMSNGDDEGSGGMSGTSITAGILFFIFAIGATLPLVGTLDMMKTGGGGMSIADSVVTRQDAPGKLQNVEKKEFSLSRSAIQEKLNAIPVFYITTTSDNNNMSTDIYLSYEDANNAAAAGSIVKGTTLDQVMYPLVLKRGRMRMAPPPSEVELAEKNLLSNNEKSYFLIPSTKAIDQYKEFNVGDLSKSDVPLFVADRLAFASPKGPQLPLFLDKSDCIASYKRLRNGKSSLPEEPTIRTSSLLETLITMEKGTRPGVNQLAFYATEQDLTKVAELR